MKKKSEETKQQSSENVTKENVKRWKRKKSNKNVRFKRAAEKKIIPKVCTHNKLFVALE